MNVTDTMKKYATKEVEINLPPSTDEIGNKNYLALEIEYMQIDGFNAGNPFKIYHVYKSNMVYKELMRIKQYYNS